MADFPIGVAVSAGNETSDILNNDETDAAQRTVIEAHFDQLTAGNIMKMSYLYPAQDTYYFTDADTLLEYADDNGTAPMPTHWCGGRPYQSALFVTYKMSDRLSIFFNATKKYR